MTFHLETFDGPLELLLTLAAKHKMDLHNIPILELIDQYTHAVDRDLSIAERYYRPASHAMKKLIRMVLEAADAGGIPVTICGLAVGNPANTVQYLKLGLRSFSMSPQNLIGVKKALLEAESKD